MRAVVLYPISAEEVIKRIKKLNNKTAGGPDNIQKRHLLVPGLPIVFAMLYNILCVVNYFPSAWRNNRTTLIPKVGQDLDKVENWRPITIGSALSRIFSSILDGRIRSVIVQNLRQKGFTSENGCKYNTMLLNEAIKASKKYGGGVFTILDVTKAFDTLPHSAIGPSLRRKGIPECIVQLILKMYSECTTTVKAANKEAVTIKLLRGVKQGDPLSPLLFNLCMERLLELIEENTDGINIRDELRIAILAFADDIGLLAKDQKEAQKQLDIVMNFLNGLGMKLSIRKCQAFQIVAKRDTWILKDAKLMAYDNEFIPNVDPSDVFKYLGSKMGPWKGLHQGIIVPDVIAIVKRLRQLALKPQQKIDLLINYVLPRFIYGMLICPPADCVLKLLGNELRQQVKEILHLVPSTATGFFYAPKTRGGLGLPRYEHIVKLALLKSAIKMRNSNDPAVRDTLNESAEAKLKQTANSLRINWPATLEDVERAKIRLKRDHLKQWMDLGSQGQGVRDFAADRTGNCWLKQYNLLKPSRFIDAIRLRTNTYGTKVVLARANKQTDIRCRRCKCQPETLGHILGLCVHTKPLRIKRHDEIKMLLANKLASNNEVSVEPHITIEGTSYRPDLIIKNEARTFIVDVTVRYENREYLQLAHEEKATKYALCQ